MDKMNGTTMDIVAENVKKMRELFPEVFTEGKVDFEALKEVLGDYSDTREERYSFTWNGKSKARMLAQTPSTGTLRPCPEESVDWDTTKNIFIEGDNLEVLKLLQKSYHKKVKMIYIDPPYNTGKDFVYKDNFKDNIKNYKEVTGQVDSEGRNLTSNPETSGRYHTDWLNMMYPRLKLARNLLRDDGVIFISIDDVEIGNLRKISDEIYGEENLIGIFCRKTKSGGGSAADSCAVEHDYVVSYAKNSGTAAALLTDFGEQYLRRYKEKDAIGPYFWDTMERSSTATKPYLIEAPDGSMLTGKWFRSETTFKSDLEKGEVRFLDKGNGAWSVQFKQRLADGKKLRTIIEESSITDKDFRSLNQELEDLVGCGLGHPPKPLKLLETLIYSVTPNGDSDPIILDFFAGSSTTAHSVMSLNARDNLSRRFVMVQLDEISDQDSDLLKNGFKNVSELSKERIRKAGKVVKENNPLYQGDLGFKTFKLDYTNIKPWDVNFSLSEQDLVDQIDNIKDERSEEDVLYEILIKYGLDLTLPIKEHSIAGKKVFDIGMGALIVCLSDSITLDVVEGIAKLKDKLNPEIMRVVFKDTGFKDDVVKTNAVQILKQAGIEDVRSL